MKMKMKTAPVELIIESDFFEHMHFMKRTHNLLLKLDVHLMKECGRGVFLFAKFYTHSNWNWWKSKALDYDFLDRFCTFEKKKQIMIRIEKNLWKLLKIQQTYFDMVKATVDLITGQCNLFRRGFVVAYAWRMSTNEVILV